MRSKLILSGVMAAAIMAFTACEDPKPDDPQIIAVESVQLGGQQILSLVVGDDEQLTYTVLPENATDKAVAWSSNAETIVTVVDGLVTAVAPGNATITVKTVNGSKSDAVNVTVTAAPIPATGVTISGDENITKIEGDADFTLTATVAPADATNKKITWTTDDATNAVLTVSEAGLVHIVAVGGPVKITATTEEGGFTDFVNVTVNSAVVPVTGVTLDRDKVTITVGETEKTTLVATVAPDEATDKNVTWSSSAEGVVTVADGELTAVTSGTATITVTSVADNTKTAACEVTVIPAPHSYYGAISFRTETVWETGTLIWSDVVMVEKARGKSTFAPGSGSNTVVDCRENINVKNSAVTHGDIFSWQALSNELTEKALCPEPWRIPSRADYGVMDAYYNGSLAKYPTKRYGDKVSAQKLVSDWGAEYGGFYYYSQSKIYFQDEQAYYWTSDVASPVSMGHYYFYTTMGGDITDDRSKTNACAIRCVKNK